MNEEAFFNGYRVSVEEEQKALEMGGKDSWRTM